jgi:hypothetical protein
MESMKHQLEVLNVLRPKVFPPKLAVPSAADSTADVAIIAEDAEKSTGLDHSADATAAGQDEDDIGRADDDGNILEASSENVVGEQGAEDAAVLN